MTQARSREEAIEPDRADLHKLGYAQELFRSMGGFSNFAISFSHHLDPDRRGHPVRLRPGLGRARPPS